MAVKEYLVIEASGSFDATNQLNEAQRLGYGLHSFQFQYDDHAHGAMYVFVMERILAETPEPSDYATAHAYCDPFFHRGESDFDPLKAWLRNNAGHHVLCSVSTRDKPEDECTCGLTGALKAAGL
jgi:hypothetical protein